jgi:hypothetical protein
MKPVILESPFAGDIPQNIRYARLCTRDSLMRGEAPLVSHLLYTQDTILDDKIQEERAMGITAGHVWYVYAAACVVYVDHSISNGMILGIERAVHFNLPVEYRRIL